MADPKTEPISQEWVKQYIDQLIKMATSLGANTPMGSACLERADHAMDLVEAWREHVR